jgi:hypothetical protein
MSDFMNIRPAILELLQMDRKHGKDNKCIKYIFYTI